MQFFKLKLSCFISYLKEDVTVLENLVALLHALLFLILQAKLQIVAENLANGERDHSNLDWFISWTFLS